MLTNTRNEPCLLNKDLGAECIACNALHAIHIFDTNKYQHMSNFESKN